MNEFAVLITYDSKVSVLDERFNDPDTAMTFVKNDILEEHKDNINNGFDSEYVIHENERRAVLTTHWADGDNVKEWEVGTIIE